jgi:LuxR family maltose regulon positive regulatory protein
MGVQELGWSHLWLGVVHYEWGDISTAAMHFHEVAHLRYGLHSLAARDSMLCLMRVHFVLGDVASAQQTLELVRQYDIDILGYETVETSSAHAQMHWLKGDAVSAMRWADAFTEPVLDQPLRQMHNAHIVRVRLLLARGRVTDVKTALELIDTLYEIADRTYNTRVKIVLLALRALALDAQGRDRAALAALREAIELAQPGGFMRTFVDLEPKMRGLLSRLANSENAPEYTHEVLTGFPTTSRALPTGLGATTAGAASVTEPLTARERDILRLMRERMSAKEIAKRLDITTLTVNRHAANLYRKLGVNTRWDAVVKAEELGIL